MFPYYKGSQPNLQLDYDDILAMYQLYSKEICQSQFIDQLKIVFIKSFSFEASARRSKWRCYNDDNHHHYHHNAETPNNHRESVDHDDAAQAYKTHV